MKNLVVLFTTTLFVSLISGMVAGCQPEPETPIALPPARPVLEFAELASDDEEAKWENELGRWNSSSGFNRG